MQRETVICGLCNYEFIKGAHVCQGCQGEIVYGATQEEQNGAGKIGLFLAGGAMAAAVYGIPSVFNSHFEKQIEPGFGLGFYGVGLVVVSGLIGAGVFSSAMKRRLAWKVRTFRKTFVR